MLSANRSASPTEYVRPARARARSLADLLEEDEPGRLMAEKTGGLTGLDELLGWTSRTFALSIPVLPEPTRREVMIAYLLFRVADTFEDAAHWPPAKRMEALSEYCALLREPSPDDARRLAARWFAERPASHSGYLSLVAEFPAVLEAFLALRAEAIPPIREHVVRSAQGMTGFVARGNERGELELADLADLRAYCYAVAGIVGEMLTELFLLGRPFLAPIASSLRERAHLFGEALQLVNVLKDSAADTAEGRRYIPRGIDRAEVFALARSDLDSASEYILALQAAGAPRGILGFTALPVELAWASLDRIERSGPGAKLTRAEVLAIVEGVERTLERNAPAARLRARARG